MAAASEVGGDHVKVRSAAGSKSSLLFGALFVACLSYCFPVHQKAQLDIPSDSMQWTDQQTGTIVEPVLIIPRYSTHTGVSTGAGHGPGAMRDRYFVAHAFVYRSDQPFVPPQPESTGMAIGWFWGFAGKGRTIDGVVVVARGYRPKWVWNLWQRDIKDQFQLEPLSEQEWKKQQERMKQWLESERIERVPESMDEVMIWGIAPQYTIEVRLTEDEREAALSFLVDQVQGSSWLSNRPLNPTVAHTAPAG